MSKDNSDLTNSDELDAGVSFSSTLVPLENKSIVHLIENFSSLFAEQLSDFVGKQTEVEFDSLECIKTKEKLSQDNGLILSTFSISTESDYGLIILDANLLDLSINFLFGHAILDEKKTQVSFGKCALKIAKEIAARSLNSLQEAVAEYIEFSPSLQKTSTQFKDISYQNISEKYYEFSFKINAKKSPQIFMFLLPEKVLEEIIFHNQHKGVTLENSTTNSSSEQLKSEVIDTTVDMVAVLPNIKLKFSDIMNLKSGDLIPISEPKEVELRVGNQKLFKAIAGQANSFRVVKLGEPINKS